ncbi:MAG TPA: hypothetical protein VGQ83_43550 [Polyangia bacterium]|jgi:hypothetical protein
MLVVKHYCTSRREGICLIVSVSERPPRPGSESRLRCDPARESGRPGGGAGRRDQVGRSGVWPASADPAQVPADAELRPIPKWGA